MLTQVLIGGTMHAAGCARYASLADELHQRDMLLERLTMYLVIAVVGGVVIALILAVCTKH